MGDLRLIEIFKLMGAPTKPEPEIRVPGPGPGPHSSFAVVPRALGPAMTPSPSRPGVSSLHITKVHVLNLSYH